MKTCIFVALALFAVAFAAPGEPDKVEGRGRLGFGIVKKVWSKVRGDDQEESVEHEANEEHAGHHQEHAGHHQEHAKLHQEHAGHHQEHAKLHQEHARHHQEHAGQVEHSELGEQAEQGEHEGFGGHDGLSAHEGDAEIDYDKIPYPYDKRFEPEEDNPNAGEFGAQGDAEIDYDKIPNPYDKRFQSEEAEPNSRPKRKDCKA